MKSESEVTESCPTLSDPVDCSLPGSSVHGSFQARVLEWGAIAFSEIEASVVKKKEFKSIPQSGESRGTILQGLETWSRAVSSGKHTSFRLIGNGKW